MEKRRISRMLGALLLSGSLLVSEASVIYGASGNPQLDGVQTENQQGQNKEGKELTPFEEYMKDCWKKKQERIDVRAYNLSVDDVINTLDDIYYHNPEYYWVNQNYNYEVNPETKLVETYIQYYQGRTGKPLDRSEELEREWEVIEEMTKHCKTDLEKALLVHEHLSNTITYCARLGDRAYNIEGAIFEKRAVGGGHARAYQYYMNRLNIPCELVNGQADGKSHVWNQIQINGKWYMVDVGLDNPTSSNNAAPHQYFLRSDGAFTEHTWDKTNEKYHPCDDTTYDNVDWRWVRNRMFAHQGGIYFIKSDFVDGQVKIGVWKYDAQDPAKPVELVLPIEDEWTINGTGEKEAGYSEIAVYDGALYFNVPRAVMKWNFDPNTDSEKVFDLDESVTGEIWSVEAANGKLYYETADGKDGWMQERQHVIDENYQKAKHPIAVTDTEMTVGLDEENVFLQALAPGAVTYTSQNPDICDTEAVWEDESSQLIPKKAGETVVTVSAAETDRYEAGSVDVKVIVTDGSNVEEKITLNYEAGENGTLQAVDAKTGASLADGAEIAPDTEVEFTAVPDEGYLVKNWIVNGGVYEEDGGVYTGTTLKRNIAASTDSVKVEFVKEEPKFIRGDVDLNGKVDIGDLRLTLRYVCQKTELDETQKLAGDVAAGEGVDIADLRKILRYVCKKIDEL